MGENDLIYQIYGFNLVHNQLITALQAYGSDTCDKELPIVIVSQTDNLVNDIKNSMGTVGRFVDAAFTDDECFLSLHNGDRIYITHGRISLCGNYFDSKRVGEEMNGPSIIIASRYYKRAVLHGSAFCYHGKAYLVLAYPGAGKSTLSTAMVKYHKNISFLTDDIICISEDGKWMFRGVHFVNLNDDSLDKLFGTGNEYAGHGFRKMPEDLKTTCDMRKYDLQVRDNVIEIGGIFVLSTPVSDGLIKIRKFDVLQSFCEILKNIKLRKMMTGDLLTQEMEIINKLIRRDIFVAELKVQHDYSKLEEVTDRLREFIDEQN